MLYPNGNSITAAKKDLIELLQFIPPVHHGFYTNLKTQNTTETVPGDYERDESN